MEALSIVLIVLVAVLAAAVVALSRRGAGSGELAGRLDQMAQAHAAQQAQLAERLQAQERALTETVDARLAALGQRVSIGLKEQTAEAAKSMSDLASRLAVIDTAQKNIMELSSQMVGLQDILANKQARGRFGEEIMENLVRDALPAALYTFQATLSGGQRVDCLVRLPNPPGPIAIDAKFPLEDYRVLSAGKSEIEMVPARRAFDAAVRKHIRDIAEKYIVPGETAEWAMLFLPSEAIHAELHANFPTVVEEARRRRVCVVSPNTMMATMTAIRALLRDVEMREQAGRIQAEVGALLNDVRLLDERSLKLERHFGQVAEDVRLVRVSSEKVLRRGQNISEVRLDDGPATDRIEKTDNIIAISTE